MKLIRGAHNLPLANKGTVATIGNFDGLHLGHQTVLEKVKKRAAKLELPACIISFEPLPGEYFKPQDAPARLTRFREKAELLQQFSVDWFLVLRFSNFFAQQNPHDFIRNFLVESLKVRHLIVGDDFKFGYRRQGNYQLLEQGAAEFGFVVQDTKSVLCAKDERISSTRIRHLLDAGKLKQAKLLLGRNYSMRGRVVHGNKQGRKLGFPTANIAIMRQKTPLCGVFAVRVHGIGSQALAAVANLGVRPTLGGVKKAILEVHLLDFAQDIYAQMVEVEFLHKIRDEQKFASLAALSSAIKADVASARQWFLNNKR